MVNTSMIQFLERFLNVTSDRQQLITNNMANIDTPGYKTADINFRSELDRLVTDGDDSSMMRTVAHHVPGLIQRPDGNDVSVDRESLLLSETQMQFKVGVQFLHTEFHRLINAINEGKES
jgi:flagellar basal-body rod protein FlgB